jgi:hypothetical protein
MGTKPRAIRSELPQRRKGAARWLDRTKAGQRWQDIPKKRGKRR